MLKSTENTESVDAYIAALDETRQPVIRQLRQTVLANLPDGFVECINYKMIGYVVPHDLFPAGYHCDPSLPLPFMNLAAQKSHYGFYHMGIYAMPELEAWFRQRYAEEVPTKLDMGKSCIRFKNPKHIPYDLVGELVKKVSVEDWISTYQKAFTR